MYGVDAPYWVPYFENIQSTDSFTFKPITENPYHIEYKNNFFDCITLIPALNHATNIIESIKECKRILKKTRYYSIFRS